MPRVKRGKNANKKRKNILSYTKGFNWGRKSKERAAKEALLHAWSHSFSGRKIKKRENRRIWQSKIKALVEMLGWKYNELINGLKKENILLNRKTLAQLAEKNEPVFKEIVARLKK